MLRSSSLSSHVVRLIALSFVVQAVLGSYELSAQGFRWPDNPENLRVLPDSVRGQQLGSVMRGFASALGVRCEHCHVGEGPNLTTYDFPSDEKLTKRKARVMIQMVRAINETHLDELTALEGSSVERLEVTCMTCHRTQPKPLLLEDILAEVIENEGIEAAITKYHELRDQYYGGFAYDFSEGVLTGLGERLAAGGNVNAAVQMLRLEIEMQGESASIYFTLGGVQAGAGMRDEAISTFEKGLALAPEEWKSFFQQQIDQLRNR